MTQPTNTNAAHTNHPTHPKMSFFVLLLSGLLASGTLTALGIDTNDQCGQEECETEKILSRQEALEDLSFMHKTYLERNLGMRSQELKDLFEAEYNKTVRSIQKPISVKDLYFKISKLAALTNDGHARVRFSPKSPNDAKVLPIGFTWLEEGLTVSRVSAQSSFKVGDKILNIGGKSVSNIAEQIDKIISTENIYGVRTATARMLRNRYILEYLDVLNKDGGVSFNVEHLDGNTETLTVDLITRPTASRPATAKTNTRRQRQQPSSRQRQNTRPPKKPSNISYSILPEKNVGILKIATSGYDEKAAKVLQEFFKKVSEKNMKTIYVDLRNNTGGQTEILDKFLEYINVKEVRYWKNNLIDFGMHKVTQQPNYIFDGKIYVAINNLTLSSATMFASTLVHNDLATSIGEPTAQSTIFYGRSQEAQLKNSGIGIGTTRVKVFLQDETYPNTLKPDIPLPKTRKSLAENTDLLVWWINSKD